MDNIASPSDQPPPLPIPMPTPKSFLDFPIQLLVYGYSAVGWPSRDALLCEFPHLARWWDGSGHDDNTLLDAFSDAGVR